MRIMNRLEHNRSWLIAAMLIAALSLIVAFAPLQAASPQASDPVNLDRARSSTTT